MENAIKRGDIFYVSKGSNGQTGSEQYPDRPALIVSNNANNASSGVVEIVYLTTQPKIDLPTHVTICSTGRESTALCEQITSVSVERIKNYIASINEHEMEKIDHALSISIAIKQKYNTPLNNEFIRIQAERDTYKELYEQLLKNIMQKTA